MHRAGEAVPGEPGRRQHAGLRFVADRRKNIANVSDQTLRLARFHEPCYGRRMAPRGGCGRTERVDAWWAAPAITAIGLLVFFGYLTFRAFNPTYVWYEPYISPTVAPPLFTPASGYPGAVPIERAWFGAFPDWWPAFLPQSPAFFLPALAIAFRLTCYYYRGAYYKAFALTPPACAVRGLPLRYRGETALLLVQNLHRYTLYAALVLLVCLWWEAGAAFVRDGRIGVGVGTIVMLVNAGLLTLYAFGCHSWRHLIGGRLDCFSCERASPPPRYRLWMGASWLNERHMAFAWVSLVWVAFTDLYIFLVSRAWIRDLSTW